MSKEIDEIREEMDEMRRETERQGKEKIEKWEKSAGRKRTE